jgi:hypothetical protein
MIAPAFCRCGHAQAEHSRVTFADRDGCTSCNCHQFTADNTLEATRSGSARLVASYARKGEQ